MPPLAPPALRSGQWLKAGKVSRSFLMLPEKSPDFSMEHSSRLAKSPDFASCIPCHSRAGGNLASRLFPTVCGVARQQTGRQLSLALGSCFFPDNLCRYAPTNGSMASPALGSSFVSYHTLSQRPTKSTRFRVSPRLMEILTCVRM